MIDIITDTSYPKLTESPTQHNYMPVVTTDTFNIYMIRDLMKKGHNKLNLLLRIPQIDLFYPCYDQQENQSILSINCSLHLSPPNNH